MSPKDLGCAVVGVGAWGGLVADQIVATDGLKLVGIADSSEGRAKTQAAQRGCRCYSSLGEVWEDADVSAVMIAVPNHQHAQLAQEAIGAGKHVVLEKPMALTTADADAIAEAAVAAKRVLMVHHTQRYFPLFSALRDLVTRGAIGEVQGIAVSRRDRLVRTKGWLQARESVGGLLYQSACHEYDLLRWLGGEITEITCRAAPRVIAPEPLDYPDLIVSQVHFQSGAVGQVWNCMTDPVIGYDGVVTGTAGSAWFDLYRAQLRWRQLRGEIQERTWLPADRWSPLAWMTSGGIAEGEVAAIAAFLENFRDAICSGTQPTVTAVDGVRAVELAQAGCLSIATNRSVKLPLRGSERTRKTYLEISVERGNK